MFIHRHNMLPPHTNIPVLSIVPSFSATQAWNTDLSLDFFFLLLTHCVKSCQFSCSKNTCMCPLAIPTFSTLTCLLILYLLIQYLTCISSCLPPPLFSVMSHYNIILPKLAHHVCTVLMFSATLKHLLDKVQDTQTQ